MSDLDFMFLAPSEEATHEESKPAEAAPTKPVEGEEDGQSDESEVLDGIASILMPKAEEDEDPPAKQPVKKREAKAEESETPEPKKPARQPILHNDKLLALADINGIGPDEAASYSTGRALLAEIRLRETERGVTRERPKAKEREEEADDDIAPPKIEWREDDDPRMKELVEASLAYARRVKERADARDAAREEEVEQLKSEHEQAAAETSRQTEAKIAQLFDEKVTSWGDEFKELIGTPQETWRNPGTDQHAELVKLRQYVLERKTGYEQLSGRRATTDDISGFLEEARFALWPDQAQTVARKEIATGLKKQKGGVGLRPSRTRDAAPAQQGDRAAKAAIGDYLASHGLDPWARRSA